LDYTFAIVVIKYQYFSRNEALQKPLFYCYWNEDSMHWVTYI